MRRIPTMIVMTVGMAMAGLTVGQAQGSGQNRDEVRRPDTQRFAVVELFTSEGCSSCPPADRLLRKLKARAEANHKPVYPLAFHVTYWDRLGWTDPFGDKAYTQRQRQYARAFNSDRIYTPQMVVNGQAQFVGSNASKADRAIDDALASKPDLGIQIDQAEVHRKSGGAKTLELTYRLTRSTSSKRLNVAVTEDDLASNVKRGENAGRHLAHDGVVRAWRQLRPSRRGHVSLTIPAKVDIGDANVVVYLEDQQTMSIAAATGMALDQAR